MAASRSRPMTPHFAAGCLVAAFSAGSAVGWGSAMLRPYLDRGVHWEAVVSLFVLMPATCLALVWALRRVRRRHGQPVLVVAITLLWWGYCAAWSLASQRIWDDVIGVTLVFWLITTALGSGLHFVASRFYPAPIGPYCPGCRYCLIGAAYDICPECGRPFELEELGVTREALQPTEASRAM